MARESRENKEREIAGELRSREEMLLEEPLAEGELTCCSVLISCFSWIPKMQRWQPRQLLLDLVLSTVMSGVAGGTECRYVRFPTCSRSMDLNRVKKT